MVFSKAEIVPEYAVMVEDDPRNLEVPAALGMTTILVGSAPEQPFIHHQTADLAGFLTEVADCGFPAR